MDRIAKLRILGFAEEDIARYTNTQETEPVESIAYPTETEQISSQQRSSSPEFVHLHVHSDYSFLDGMCRIEDLVRRAKELSMPAVAITDHGGMHGAIQFYKAARAAGIKPIIGCEVYYVPDMSVKEKRENWHLVLLAKNLDGYRNLMKITTAGYLEGHHHKPRVDLDLISQYSDGLIAMTACVRGYVPAMLLEDRADEAHAELGRLRDIFSDDLYVEVMDNGMEEQKRVNPELIKLAEQMGISALATNDCHYVNADDAFAHEVLLCIQTKKTLADDDRFRFKSDQFYFKSQDEMAALFPKEYLTRTLEVAEKCNLELDFSSKVPAFVTPDGSTEAEYLWQRIQDGARERYGSEIDIARQERFQREFEVINNTGFSGYFCTIDDVVQFARQRKIRVGAGRGSAVASLTCFSLGITDVDPIEHDLLFERFLTEDRISPPDVDLDFDSSRRGEIIDYMHSKYGHTAEIVTFSSLRPRSLVRDVGRVLGVSQADINAAAQRIPDYTDKTLAELRDEIPELGRIDPRVVDIGTRLHGLIRHCGQHPGGVVVSDRPLPEIIPLFVSKGAEMTQFDKNDLEAAGLLKIDILGNDFLAAVEMTTDLIRERHGIDINDIPMDDPATFALLRSGDVNGIFQLGARWGRQLALRMQPQRLEDIVHILALGRPGVLDAGFVDSYFQARETGNVDYLHPSLEPVLSDTYGIIIFQEQIMRAAIDVAGFSPSESDRLRKAIGAKDMELLVSMEAQFIDGCVRQDFPKDKAEKLFEQINYFGGYGFNKAHAAGYGSLTYQTAYLKANWPLEYLTSMLSVKISDKDERLQCIRAIRQHGIRILPPDVNASIDRCIIVDDDTIRLPLTVVDRLGDEACVAIVQERLDGGAFMSYDDFFARVPKGKVNIRIKRNLVKAGAFDGLEDRTALLEKILEVADPDILQLEREALGLYVTGHPLDDFDYDDGTIHIAGVQELPVDSEFRTVGIIEKIHTHVDVRGGNMAFVTIADQTHQLEVTVFASLYRGDFEEDDTLHVQGRLDGHEPLKAVAIDYEVVDLQTVAGPA